MRAKRWEPAALATLAVLYIGWAALFIYRSSYIAIDGNRYFGLFDDAMISMRYGWNLAHGIGLVWNAGQRVEGYTNLLMTLLMSLPSLVLSKPLAVAVVQVAGIPTVLISAILTWKVAREIGLGKMEHSVGGVPVFLCVLLYYPLSYWTLMGMETGILALLLLACIWFGLRWLRTERLRDLAALSICSSLAFLARNDSALLTGTVFAYLALEVLRQGQGRLTQLLLAGVGVMAVAGGQTIFRHVYYGSLLPNTYTLKLTGFPLYIRLIGGTRFVLEFLRESWLVLSLAIMGIVLRRRRTNVLLAGPILAAVCYQIYTGGDPWPSWRLLAPAMPGVMILAADGATAAVHRVRPLTDRGLAASAAIAALLLAGVGITDAPFYPELTLQSTTSAAIANRVNTDSAIAIQALTAPGATVGVIWAGTLPYYSDRTAVDFLGKSDPTIARLPADITGSVSWAGMISVPGHNKYDLHYSIIGLRPTYIQVFSWGYETVKPFVMQNYDRVEYHGQAGTKTIFLLKDSTLVCWEACKGAYRINAWPGEQ